MSYNLFKTKKDATTSIKSSVNLLMKNFKEMKTDEGGYETLDVIRIGRFLEGVAYYHEVDQHYTCVGFEVERDVRFDLGEHGMTKLEREVGFFSVWVGRAHSTAPFTFEESYQPFGKAHRFDNGFGDHFEVTKELASFDEVTKAINANT